jgi:hypothetical protein
MPAQNYIANVVFGSNTTQAFLINANTFQDAAIKAALAYDQNTAVTLPNGDSRFAARLNPGTVNSVGGNNRSVTVTVTDPSSPPFGPANTFTLTVSTVAFTAPTVATYSV